MRDAEVVSFAAGRGLCMSCMQEVLATSLHGIWQLNGSVEGSDFQNSRNVSQKRQIAFAPEVVDLNIQRTGVEIADRRGQHSPTAEERVDPDR